MSDPIPQPANPISSVLGGIPAGEVGAIAGAVTSVANLVDGILTRADRDGPEKEFHENIITLQNAYAGNLLDSDGFRLWIDQLLNATGNPLTPTGDVGTGRRELLHALLVNTISLIRERKLAAKALSALEQRK